jgi:hypothetical protein
MRTSGGPTAPSDGDGYNGSESDCWDRRGTSWTKNSEVLIFHRPRDRAYARKCPKAAIASVDGWQVPATSCPEHAQFAPNKPHRVDFCLPISLDPDQMPRSATPRATQDDRRAPERLFIADALLHTAGERGADRFASPWKESYH